MKLFVQIPCLNEAETLPQVLSEIPVEIDGFDTVETVVIDDGSTDATLETARTHGVDHVLRHDTNRGLARAFFTGVEFGIESGADVIVNIDADGQYPGTSIPDIATPIAHGRADIAIGARSMPDGYYTAAQRRLHGIGSRLLNFCFDTRVTDPPSGLRGYSQRAASLLVRNGTYSYTLDTAIQGGKFDMTTINVPVPTRNVSRPSRLVKSNRTYVMHSAADVMRSAVRSQQ